MVIGLCLGSVNKWANDLLVITGLKVHHFLKLSDYRQLGEMKVFFLKLEASN